MKKHTLLFIAIISLQFLIGPVFDFQSTLTKQSEAQAKARKKQGKHIWNYRRRFSKNKYKKKDEVKLGSHYMSQLVSNFRRRRIGVDLKKHRRLRARVQRIVRRIAKVSDVPDFPYEVHIFDRPKVANAFCLPGGYIGVYTGLFDKKIGLVNINSDAEIAAVLSHEIAHATMRHGTRKVSQRKTLSNLGTIISIGISGGAGHNAGYLFDSLFHLGTGVLVPSYSRKFESESDRVGMYYMAKAGYDPQAAVNVWKKAAKRKGNNKHSIYASHPSNGVRAKKLEKWLPEATAIYKGELKPPPGK